MGEAGERLSKARRHEIDEPAKFQGHEVARYVDQVHRYRLHLVFLQYQLESPRIQGLGHMVVKQLREPDVAYGGIDGGIRRGDLEPRGYRHGMERSG